MTPILQDLRLAWRGLVKRPGFTVTVLVTLGLGIGATTAIFSVVEGVLLRPLPYPSPDRLVQIWTQFPEQGAFEFPASRAEYVDYRDESGLYEGVAAYTRQSVTLTGGGEPERLPAVFATASLWSVLGVEAASGRTFSPREDTPGSAQVAVVSHGFWQRRLGGDPGALGRAIIVEGTPATVIGVLPAGFRFPDRDVELWMPVQIDESAIATRTGHYLRLVGRMRPGVSIEQVSSELEAIVARWGERYEHVHPMIAVDLGEQILGDSRGPLTLLMAATACVLLIACVNVAGLLLARGEGRRQELSVRTALGAGRRRLLRQLLTESALLGILGGVLGLAVAFLFLSALRLWEPGDLPRLDQVGVSGAVLAFATAVSLATGLVFGLVPALRVSGFDLAQAIREGGTRTAGAVRQRLRGALVVAEIALAVVLVVGAGLLLRSLSRLQQADPGLDPEYVLTADISLPGSAYPGAPEVAAFYRKLLPGLESLPGVRSASLVNFAPFVGGARLETFYVEGRPVSPGDEGVGADLQMVTPAYFRTLGLPLLSGQTFTDADREDAPRVVILTESVARSVFPGESPIGRRLLIRAARPEEPSFEVVGVVGDVPHFGAVEGLRPQIYLPLTQALTEIGGLARSVSLVMKTAVEPTSLLGAVRRQVWEIDRDLAISGQTTLEQALVDTWARPRFTTLLLGAFGAVATLLAAVGIYGLLAHLVSLRRHELGIRAALGATRRDLTGLVLRQGLLLAGIGVVLGLSAALLVSRQLQRFLFATSSTDLLIFAATPVVLTVAVLLACTVPARRAAAADPVRTLRHD